MSAEMRHSKQGCVRDDIENYDLGPLSTGPL